MELGRSQDDGPAFGVALLAGVGTGIYPSVEEACRSIIRMDKQTIPCTVHRAAYDRFYAVYRQLYGCVRDRFAEISQIVG